MQNLNKASFLFLFLLTQNAFGMGQTGRWFAIDLQAACKTIKTAAEETMRYYLPDPHPLFLAAAQGNQDIFKDPNFDTLMNKRRATDGRTALMIAIWHKRTDFAKGLIDRNADLDSKVDRAGYTAIGYIIKTGNRDLFDYVVPLKLVSWQKSTDSLQLEDELPGFRTLPDVLRILAHEWKRLGQTEGNFKPSGNEEKKSFASHVWNTLLEGRFIQSFRCDFIPIEHVLEVMGWLRPESSPSQFMQALSGCSPHSPLIRPLSEDYEIIKEDEDYLVEEETPELS